MHNDSNEDDGEKQSEIINRFRHIIFFKKIRYMYMYLVKFTLVIYLVIRVDTSEQQPIHDIPSVLKISIGRVSTQRVFKKVWN